jgi:hypothetical protein
MTTHRKNYTTSALTELRVLTEYEAWFLEAVYEIVDQRLAVEGVDELIYPPNGGPPTQTIYGVANIIIGDWRPAFLKAGMPLVFLTAFKLLDMLIEWILVQKGRESTHRFEEKIRELKGPVLFPELIATRPWLQERLIALYEHLEPLRGTIIHTRHFKTTEGMLQVSSSKRRKIGPKVVVSEGDLRNLALALISVLRYVEGTWTMDIFREKRLRRALDELAHLHESSIMGQLPAGFLNVRLYVSDIDPIEFDIDRIKRDIAEKRKGQDVIFDIRIIIVANEYAQAKAFLVPWDQLLDSGSHFRKNRAELATYAVPSPEDIDSAAVAYEMGLKLSDRN